MAHGEFMILAKVTAPDAGRLDPDPRKAHTAIRRLSAALSSLDDWSGVELAQWYVSQGSHDFVIILRIDQQAFVESQPPGLEDAPLHQLAILVAASVSHVAGVSTETLGLTHVAAADDGMSVMHQVGHSCTLKLQNQTDERLRRP